MVRTILDLRVPQPGREADYGVPECIIPAVDQLYIDRNTCSDADVEIIDNAILRLLEPWIRPAE